MLLNPKHAFPFRALCCDLFLLALLPLPASSFPSITHHARGTDEHLVVAIAVEMSRVSMFHGSRSWRLGVRTFCTMNCTTPVYLPQKPSQLYSEQVECYPDPQTNPTDPLEVQSSSPRPDAVRVALTPFLAHNKFRKKYKWMLYGEDDTVFFLEGVQKLLSRMDPEQPVALTDHFWGASTTEAMHPNPAGIRCLACNASSKLSDEKSLHIPHRVCGGVCRAENMCTSEDSTPCKPSAAHIGSGIIFSGSFLDQVSLEEMEKCLQRYFKAGEGPRLMSMCLLEQNLGFTDPGVWMQHKDLQYMIFNPPCLSGGPDLLRSIAGGQCDGACQHSLQHAVSGQVSSEGFAPGPLTAAYAASLLVTKRMAERSLLELQAVKTECLSSAAPESCKDSELSIFPLKHRFRAGDHELRDQTPRE